MSTRLTGPERQEILELLPWYSVGTLSAADQAKVEAALADDPDLGETLARIDEERVESVLSNEAQPLPSTGALDRLMHQIETEAPRSAPKVAGAGFLDRIIAMIGDLSPRALTLAGAMAALVIVAEGGFIASMAFKGSDTGARYETASVNAGQGPQAHFLVQFATDASIDKIAAFLRDHHATIVDGPKAGGLFRVAVADDAGPALLAELQTNKDLIRFAATSQ